MSQQTTTEVLVSNLSKSTGTPAANIVKVLDELGLTEILGEVESRLGSAAPQQVSPQDIRLSVKVGRLTIAL